MIQLRKLIFASCTKRESAAGVGAINPFAITDTLTINSEGTVAYSDSTTAGAGDVSLIVSAKGAVVLDEHADTGDISVTTTTGDVVVGGTAALVAASANAADGDITASTDNGDITVVLADVAAGTVQLTAVGDGDATAAGADGDVIVTNATAAATLTVDATGGIVVTDANSATTVSLTAGQASSATTAGLAAMTSLTLEGANASAATVFDLGTGSGVALTSVTINGANDVTLAMDAANIATAVGNTGFAITNAGTGAAKLRIDTDAAVDLAGHLSGVTVLTGATMTTGSTITVSSGATVEVGADLTELEIAGAATPGNTVTVVVNDDDAATAADGNAFQLAALDVDNMATVTVELNDTEQAITGGAYDVNTGNLIIKGAGDLTLTSVVAASVNASDATGDIDITLTSAGATIITTGSGANDFTLANTQEADYTIDGGDGIDTLIVANANVDLSDDTVSLTSIEKIDLATNSLDITLSGAQAHGSTYTVVGGAATDLFNVTAGVATGETVDISCITASGTKITLTGSAGTDTLTGSSTFANIINAGNAADNVIGGGAVDTVDGGAGDDNITAGEGADLITGGTGADTISLTEATVAIDTVFFAAVGDGSTAAASGAQFSGFDVVTGFGSTDIVDVNGITVLATEGEVLLSSAGSTAAIDLADSEYTDVDAIVTFLNDAGSVFDNGGDEYSVAITFSDFSAIYGIADAGVTDTVEAGEVTLLGTVDAVILTANMDFIT